MDKFMDNPWFLRFTALFLAVILFYSVKIDEGSLNGNKVGDQLDIIRDVPVAVYYDNENLVVTGVPETVNVTIEGPINLVQTTKLLKDFTLIVDLRTLTMGKHQVRIQTENLSEKLQARVDPASIDVIIEEKITETFPVEPEMNERLLAADFNVVNMEVVPSTIEVTGAKSIVESISFVKATVSGEQGINESFEYQAKVRVLDRDLNKLDVTMVPAEVTVKVEIAENSKEVPITLNSKGTPPENVVIDSISSEVESVTLSGPSKVLDLIDEINVDVDVSKIDGPKTIEINVAKPNGVSEMSVTKLAVKVEATVEEPEEETDELDEDGIATETVEFQNVPVAVIGLDQKFKGTLLKPDNGMLTLTVMAESDVVKELEQSDFTVSIDASETATEGEQDYPVTVSGPDNIRWRLSDDVVTMWVELA